MHVLIIGAAGMVGRKLAEAISRNGGIAGAKVNALTLVDVISPSAPDGYSGKVETYAADISDPTVATTLVAG